jgi:hypothetical protein
MCRPSLFILLESGYTILLMRGGSGWDYGLPHGGGGSSLWSQEPAEPLDGWKQGGGGIMTEIARLVLDTSESHSGAFPPSPSLPSFIPLALPSPTFLHLSPFVSSSSFFPSSTPFVLPFVSFLA